MQQYKLIPVGAQVIEYLSKKGYSRTEAMLRTESAAYEPDGSPIVKPLDGEMGIKLTRAIGNRSQSSSTLYMIVANNTKESLRTWIESALDIYRVCINLNSC